MFMLGYTNELAMHRMVVIASHPMAFSCFGSTTKKSSKPHVRVHLPYNTIHTCMEWICFIISCFQTAFEWQCVCWTGRIEVKLMLYKVFIVPVGFQQRIHTYCTQNNDSADITGMWASNYSNVPPLATKSSTLIAPLLRSPPDEVG